MWIECSEFNFKLLILLIYPIFNRLGDISSDAYIKDKNRVFKTFKYYLSDSFSFIPFLIVKISSKRSHKNTNEHIIKLGGQYASYDTPYQGTNTMLIKNNIKKVLKNILFLIILCCLGIFSYNFSYFFSNKNYDNAKQSLGIFFTIFEYTLFSVLILKLKLYKHHFVSAGIMGIILVILFIITIFYMNKGYIFKAILYYFLNSLCFGLFDVLCKKYMDVFYKNSYFLMIVVSLINMIGLLIYELITYYCNPDIGGILNGFQNNISSISNFFIFILDIILQWAGHIGIFLTIYYFSPCHYFISRYFSEYINYLLKAKDRGKDFYSTINIVIFSIAFFINFFCTLIFNEVLIINFWNLDYNTRKRIQQREIKEIEEAPLTDSQRDSTELGESFSESSKENSSINS